MAKPMIYSGPESFILKRLPEEGFTYRVLSKSNLISASNGEFVGKNVGCAELFPSKKIRNDQLCLNDLIKPPSIIDQKYMIGTYNSPAVNLYRLDNCFISNQHGVILRTDIDSFFGPSARFLQKRPMYGIERDNEKEIKLPLALTQAAVKVETALVFHSAAVNSYYHWHIETLPLLMALRDEIVSGDIVPIWARQPTRFQKASLQSMGLLKFIKSIDAQLIYAKRAFWGSTLKSFPNSRFTPLIGQTFEYIKQRELAKLKHIKADLPKNIHIIRPDMGRRPLVNEASLTAALKPLGCMPVDPAKLSYSEQIQLFNGVETIVAQHGGALTNVGFSNAGTQILEIVGENYVNPCFWGLADIKGALYAATAAKAIDRDDVKNKNAAANIDIATTISVYKALKSQAVNATAVS